jgi:hypothetical protein
MAALNGSLRSRRNHVATNDAALLIATDVVVEEREEKVPGVVERSR